MKPAAAAATRAGAATGADKPSSLPEISACRPRPLESPMTYGQQCARGAPPVLHSTPPAGNGFRICVRSRRGSHVGVHVGSIHQWGRSYACERAISQSSPPSPLSSVATPSSGALLLRLWLQSSGRAACCGTPTATPSWGAARRRRLLAAQPHRAHVAALAGAGFRTGGAGGGHTCAGVLGGRAITYDAPLLCCCSSLGGGC